MQCERRCVAWLGLIAGAFWAGTALAQPPKIEDRGSKIEDGSGQALDTGAHLAPVPAPSSIVQLQASVRRVPFDDLPAALRERVRHVLEQPTLFAHGPTEVFAGRRDMYEWLLDHPDAAARAWRRLGAPCLPIADRGQGVFGTSDGDGTDVTWQTAYRGERLRVWFAEGKVRPALLVPTVPVQAVVVLRYGEGKDSNGRAVLRHQADIFFHTDSKTAVAVARLLGPSAPKLAEQCLGQLEMFFSALTWYFDKHPDRVDAVLHPPEKPSPGLQPAGPPRN